MYKYFEPNIITILDKLVALGKPVDKPISERIETS